MLAKAGIEAILSRKHKKQQLSLELVTHHDVVIEDPLVERRQKHPRDCQNANQSLRLRQLTWPPPLDRSCEDGSIHQSSHAESENLSGRFTRVRSGERSREIPADKMMNRETEPTPATPQPARGEPTLPEVAAVDDLSPRDWLAVARNAGKRMLDDNMTMIASALAYSTFFAIPSVLLAVVGLFTLLAGPGTIDTLIRHLGQLMPAQATQLLRGSLVRLDKQPSAGLTMTIVGFALAFWAMTGAMTSYMTALNLAYERKDSRPFVKKRITALAMVVCIGSAFLLVAGLLIFGPPIEKYLGAAIGAGSILTYVWWAAQWPILVAGLLAAFATLLWLGPDIEHPRWRFLTVGSAIAVAIWLLASGAFAFYTARFGSYNKTWGSLAAVIIMLTWLWLTSLALLYGAEFNAEAERSRELRRREPAERELQVAPRG
jgi:membrane protein